MAQRGKRPVRTVRTNAPMDPLPKLRRQPPPQRNATGKIIAVMLGALFVSAVLLAAVKGFGALGHPGWGLAIGIAVLVLSGLLYWRQTKLAADRQGPAD